MTDTEIFETYLLMYAQEAIDETKRTGDFYPDLTEDLIFFHNSAYPQSNNYIEDWFKGK